MKSITNISDFYLTTRALFSHFSEVADQFFIRKYGEVSIDMSSLWFEELANTINKDMNAKLFSRQHKALFDFMVTSFNTGNDEIKRCIDVAFVENLFWRVSREGTELFWKNLPSALQSLYVGFHVRPPI